MMGRVRKTAIRVVVGCLAGVGLVLVPLAAAASGSLGHPALSAPAFYSARSIFALTSSPAPASMKITALRSGAVLRSAYVKGPDYSSLTQLIFTFKKLPPGSYKLCVHQQGIAPVAATAAHPARQGWAAASRCVARVLAIHYFGSFGGVGVQAVLVKSKLSIQLRDQAGFNVDGCEVVRSGRQLAVLSLHDGRFATSIAYRGRHATMTGIGPNQRFHFGPIFHGRFMIRGTVNSRMVRGTIGSSSAQCPWHAKLRIGYWVTD